MTTKLVGIVTDIFPPEIFNNFSKRVIWLKQPDSERYPQHWAVEAWQEDIKYVKDLSIGDRIEAEIEIRGKYWDKHGREGIINTLKMTGFKIIEKIGS